MGVSEILAMLGYDFLLTELFFSFLISDLGNDNVLVIINLLYESVRSFILNCY